MLISRSCQLLGMSFPSDEGQFAQLTAGSAGTADVRQVFEQAKNGLKLTGRYVSYAVVDRAARLIGQDDNPHDRRDSSVRSLPAHR